MPGARELRELCQALTISPNKLLFGSEAPFRERSYADLLTDVEAEDDQVSRGRATFLLTLLSSDERNAILTLARALALARHGESKVKEVMQAADAVVGVSREFGKLTRDAIVSGEGINPEQIESSGRRLVTFMDKQGHKKPPEKLPKK